MTYLVYLFHVCSLCNFDESRQKIQTQIFGPKSLVNQWFSRGTVLCRASGRLRRHFGLLASISATCSWQEWSVILSTNSIFLPIKPNSTAKVCQRCLRGGQKRVSVYGTLKNYVNESSLCKYVVYKYVNSSDADVIMGTQKDSSKTYLLTTWTAP